MLALRLHTDFSLLKSMVPAEAYVEALKDRGYSAGAISDFNCGFGWVDFFFKMKSAGLKPVLGTCLEIALIPDSKQLGWVCFYVLNSVGYRNLNRILSAHSFGTLNFEKILNCQEGLILTLTPDHPHLSESSEFLKSWNSQNLFFEVHRYENAPDESSVREAAARYGARCMAAQPVYFLNPEDRVAHEVLMCIGAAKTIDDESRPQLPSAEFYLKTKDEMQRLFQDVPEFLAVNEEILNRVDFEFETDTYHLPSFGNDKDVYERFYKECHKGLENRLELIFSQNPKSDRSELEKQYRERLHRECEIIRDMKFPGYFLIVADFIGWSKSNNIPVGPGRGSGAGSLAAYCLRITDIDPIRYNLLFERFLNPERVSLPDFDVDFCIHGRDRVIQYVREKYNLKGDLPDEERLKVSQIITYGKMKSKAVIRDVGRAMGIPYSDVDAIAKLVPNVLNVSLKEAYELEPEFENLRNRDPKADQLLRVAEQLEGLNRHSSVHAAGVVIADDVLTKYLPIFKSSDSEIVSQYEMKAVEKIGLVKFDFLGLRNLTVIQDCIRLLGKEIDLLKIDYNDSKVMAEISTGETMGIFQLESSGMRDVIRRLQPNVFEDLIAIVALYRPGPLEGGMVDDFILRKRGQKEVTYPVSALEPILKETYGVFVYQEQVMGTANLMAGFSLGEADLLRRAMGKKIAEEMGKQREKFVAGAVANKFDEKKSQQIFDLMSEFAKYGFNKSHAAAYAMITLQTAYLKTYYPEAFFAALLSSEKEDTEKTGIIIRTAQKRGIPILPPHINASDSEFSLEHEADGKMAVRYGLAAIKNLGHNVAKAIMDERQENGVFKDYTDFFKRISSHLLNRRQAECLIRSGAMDGLGLTRSSLCNALDILTGLAQAEDKARRSGQQALFSQKPKIKELEEWPDKIRLNDEKHLMGTYMTGHPLEGFQAMLSSYKAVPIAKILMAPVPPREKEIQIAGMVTGVKQIMTKKGTKMAFFTLEDIEASVEVVIFSDLYSKKSDLVVSDRLLLVSGQVVRESGATRLLARSLNELSLANFSQMQIKLRDNSLVEKLPSLMKEGERFKGALPLKVKMPVEANVEGTALKQSYVLIDTALEVQTHPQFITWIEAEFGQGSVELV